MKWILPFVAIAALIPCVASADTTLGTAIGALPYTITTAGTYYFTRDLYYTAATGIAVTIEAGDVTIDLNGHTLIATAGAANTAVGISSNHFNSLTITDGSIRGFLTGISLASTGDSLSNLFVTANFRTGILINGDNTQILNDRICNIGGSTVASAVSTAGISLTGTYAAIASCGIENVFAADTAGHSATGILLDGCSNVVVSNSRVLGPGAGTAPKAVSTGLATVTTTNLILLSNIVTGMDAGFNLSGAASGKYGDNITASDSTPYNSAGTGMIDIGNNN